MFVKWLAKRLEDKMKSSRRVLFLDPDGEYDFALSELENQLDGGFVNAEHPFKAKYLAEKEYEEEPCVIYVNSKAGELNYLAEYAATGGVFNQSLYDFVMGNKKLEGLGESLVEIAAKASIGEDEEYWDNIQLRGKSGILGNLDRRALHFLTDPEEQAETLKEEGLFDLFHSAVMDNYGIEAPPGNVRSLEEELGRATLLAGMSFDVLESEVGGFSERQKKELKDLYKQWMDSAGGREAFKKHVETVEDSLNWEEVLSEIVPWDLDPDHPFPEADKKIQEEYLEKELDGEGDLNLEQKDFIYERGSSQAVEALETSNWQVFTLLIEYFENKEEGFFSDVNSIEDFLASYEDNLWRLDTARRLSYEGAADEELAAKVEGIYRKEWEKLDKLWYELIGKKGTLKEYRGTTIRNLIKVEENPAVILADGFRYELARDLFEKLEGQEVELEPSLTALPSITSVGMGVLATSGKFSLDQDFSVNDRETGTKIDGAEKRMDNLKELVEGKVEEKKVTDSDLSVKAEGLPVFYYRDLDKMGESGGREALSYFSEVVDRLANVIRELLDAGYSSVHLTSDHGFVFSEPEESEKIPTDKLNPRVSSDRFVAGPNLKEVGGAVKLSPDYLDEEIAVPLGRNVFKTPSTYEFMHGGASPQELIVPKLRIRRSKETTEDKPAAVIDEESPKKVKNRVFDVSVALELKEKKLFEEKRKVSLLVTRGQDRVFDSGVLELESGSANSVKIEVKLEEGSEEGEYTAYLLDGDTGDKLDRCKLDYEPLRGDLGL